MDCPVVGKETPYRGVEVWSDEALVRWDWSSPQIFSGFDANGARVLIDPGYASYPWAEFNSRAGTEGAEWQDTIWVLSDAATYSS